MSQIYSKESFNLLSDPLYISSTSTSASTDQAWARRRLSRCFPALLTILSLVILGCEPEATIGTSNYHERPVKGSVGETGDSRPDMALDQSQVDLMIDEGIDVGLDSGRSTADQMLDMTLELDQTVTMSPDLSLDLDVGDLDVSDLDTPDMSQGGPPCVETERRRGRLCGYEVCQDGVWVRDLLDFDPCNNHDDNCDGEVDEPPGVDLPSSSCCTDLQCLTRAYCEAGECISLADGACLLNGDCEVYEGCEEERCVTTHMIVPPQASASCDAPLILNIGELNSASGQVSSQEQNTASLSGCFSSPERDRATAAGNEVIFSFTPRGALTLTYYINAQVKVNDRVVQSVLTISESCSELGHNLFCVDSNERGLVEGSATLTQGTTYFAILDTYGVSLEGAMLNELAQHPDVTYEITISTSPIRP